MCNRYDEDAGHLFLKCKAAGVCWLLHKEEVRQSSLSCTSPTQVLSRLWELERKDQLFIAVFLCPCWVEPERNLVNAGESGRPAAQVCHMVGKPLLEFEEWFCQVTATGGEG